MDQWTRQLMSRYKALRSKEDIHRHYESRKKGGRGIASNGNCVDVSILEVGNFIKKNKERVITTARNSTDNIRRNKTTITRKQKWEYQLYWYFKRQAGWITIEKTWPWQTKGILRRETKSLLIAAQNNTIRTNYINAKSIMCNRIASEDSVVTETKRLIKWWAFGAN